MSFFFNLRPVTGYQILATGKRCCPEIRAKKKHLSIMKTLRFKPLMAGVAIALMVGFVSCEKAMDEPVARPESAQNSQEGVAKHQWGAHRWWLRNAPPELCLPYGFNCFDPVIIRGMYLSELDSAIMGGSIGVKSFFQNKEKWENILPGLGATSNLPFLYKLQSGNYSMEKIPGRENLLFYVAKANDSNEEFTFQIFIE